MEFENETVIFLSGKYVLSRSFSRLTFETSIGFGTNSFPTKIIVPLLSFNNFSSLPFE